MCLQHVAPSTKKSIDVLISVSNNEEIDVYFAKDSSIYKERTKCKNPTVLVVPQGIVELKSQCQKKTLKLDDSLKARREGFYTYL